MWAGAMSQQWKRDGEVERDPVGEHPELAGQFPPLATVWKSLMGE